MTITPHPTDSPFHAHATANFGFDAGSVVVLQQPVPTQVQSKVTTTWRPVPSVHAPAAATPVSTVPPAVGFSATAPGQVQQATTASSIHDTQVAPVSFQAPAPVVAAPTPVATPTVVSEPKTVSEQWILMLQTHADAGHRVWAAGNLAGIDGWTNHAAVQALVRGAREDRDVSVRIACIRALAHMQVTSQLVIGTIQDLHADPDPTIQQAARSALGQLCSLPGPDEMQAAH